MATIYNNDSIDLAVLNVTSVFSGQTENVADG